MFLVVYFSERGKGGYISQGPSHHEGAKSLRGWRKIPTMSQVLSSIQYICFWKTSVSNMRAPAPD